LSVIHIALKPVKRLPVAERIGLPAVRDAAAYSESIHQLTVSVIINVVWDVSAKVV